MTVAATVLSNISRSRIACVCVSVVMTSAIAVANPQDVGATPDANHKVKLSRLPVWQFRGIEPGVSTQIQLLADPGWGDPIEIVKLDDGGQEFHYQIGDNYRVRIDACDVVIGNIDIDLPAGVKRADIVSTLGLSDPIEDQLVPSIAQTGRPVDERWTPILFGCGRVIVYVDPASGQARQVRYYGPDPESDPNLILMASLSSGQVLLDAIQGVQRRSGSEHLTRRINQMVSQSPAGITLRQFTDVSRPWLFLVREEPIDEELAFLQLDLYVPTEDTPALLQQLESELGPATQVHASRWELERDRFTTVSDLGKQWAVFSTGPRITEFTPKSPQPNLEFLNAKSGVAAHVSVGNLPMSIRKDLLQRANAGLSEFVRQSVQNAQDVEAQVAMVEPWLTMLEDHVSGLDSLSTRVYYSHKVKNLFWDGVMVARPATRIARRMNPERSTAELPSFRQSGAFLWMASSKGPSTQDVDGGRDAINRIREQLLAGEVSEAAPVEVQHAAALLQRYANLMLTEIQRRGSRSELCVLLEPKQSALLFGMALADADQMRPPLESMVRLIIDQDRSLQGSRLRQGDVLFNVLRSDVEFPEWATALVGEDAEIAVGTGPDGLYLGVGHQAAQRLASTLSRDVAHGLHEQYQSLVQLKPAPLARLLSLRDSPAIRSAADNYLSKSEPTGGSGAIWLTLNTADQTSKLRLSCNDTALEFISAMVGAVMEDFMPLL